MLLLIHTCMYKMMLNVMKLIKDLSTFQPLLDAECLWHGSGKL